MLLFALFFVPSLVYLVYADDNSKPCIGAVGGSGYCTTQSTGTNCQGTLEGDESGLCDVLNGVNEIDFIVLIFQEVCCATGDQRWWSGYIPCSNLIGLPCGNVGGYGGWYTGCCTVSTNQLRAFFCGMAVLTSYECGPVVEERYHCHILFSTIPYAYCIGSNNE